MDGSIRFWNWFAEKYAKKPVADQEAYQGKLDATQRYLTPESRVLEYGCGTGSTALYHAPHVASVLAIDYSKKMIEIANRKKKEAGVGNVEFQKATVFDIPDTPDFFDAVLALNVIHLVDNPEATIARSYRLLKSGGVFVSSTACIGKSAGILKLVLPLGGFLGLIPKVRFFTKKDLEGYMTRVGFKILEKSTPGKDQDTYFVIAQK